MLQALLNSDINLILHSTWGRTAKKYAGTYEVMQLPSLTAFMLFSHQVETSRGIQMTERFSLRA